MRPWSRLALASLFSSVAVCFPSVALSQEASPYLPINNWAQPFIEHLIAAGLLPDPTPLTRPWRTDQVLRALDAVDSTTVTRAEWAVVRQVRSDLTRQERGPTARLDVHAGVAAGSHARRDPLREAGVGQGTFSGGAALTLYLGSVVFVSHPYFDTRLKYDPDWFGKKDRRIAGRAAESYISAQWRFGELFFGRLDRNWGPSGVQGLLLSDNPYGLDHLAITLGTTRLQLQAIATQLDDRTDSTGALVHRYMVQHRLWLRPSDDWSFALWEGSVLSGAGREFEPWYLNVMNVGYIEQLNTGTNVNNFAGFDFERRGDVTVFGQLMLDDIQVDRKSAADKKPISYALTA